MSSDFPRLTFKGIFILNIQNIQNCDIFKHCTVIISNLLLSKVVPGTKLLDMKALPSLLCSAMKFSEASLKPSSDEKYFRYFISCYFSDLNGGCEACVCISVMYCGLRGLSIFQSQLLQTIISCFVQLKRLQRTRTMGFETKCPK